MNLRYLHLGKLHIEVLGRGTWLDTGTHASLLDAGNFVEVIERRQGLKIACLEEIAYRRGWITSAEVEVALAKYGKSQYGKYLLQMLDGQRRRSKAPPTVRAVMPQFRA